MRAARCACVALLAALAWAAPAGAAPDRVLVLTEDGRVRAHGAGLLPDTDAAAPHRASSARRGNSRRSAARRSRGPTAVAAKRKRRTVLRELKRLRLDDYAARRATWKDAKRRATGLDGTRASEMGAVIKIVKRIARRGELSTSRVAPLWLTVEQNLRWWSEGTIPSSGQRIEFEGSELVWQYYPGQGLNCCCRNTCLFGDILKGRHKNNLNLRNSN
jgi:hypothetical protein